MINLIILETELKLTYISDIVLKSNTNFSKISKFESYCLNSSSFNYTMESFSYIY